MSHTIGQTRQDDRQSHNSSLADLNSSKLNSEASLPVPTLSDADYEFLFNQLLEGITHGWHDRRIVKFFVRLGDRGRAEDWIAWLQRLQVKASTLPLQSRHQLGTMMVRLGELTRAASEVAEIGAASYRIGKKLLFEKTPIIWEYAGSDLPSQHPIETESELSSRLPIDFTALGSDESPKKANEASELAHENTIIEDRHEQTKENSNYGSQAESDLDNYLSIDEIVASSTLSAGLDLQPNGDRQKETDKSKLPEKSETLESPTNLSDFPTSTDDVAPIDSKTVSELELPSFSTSEEDLANETKALEDASSIDKTQQITAAYLEDPKAINIAQVMNLIQEDEELAQQISQKLNLNTAQTETASELDRSCLELIESWFNLGLKQVSAGELTQAIVSWEKALNINPNLSEAWHNRGSALGRLGDYHAAVESFQNALTIDPDNYQAWNDRAHALYQLENWSEAVNSWNNAIKITPGNHLFWYSRGCALEQLKRWDDAIASHEKALEIAPDFQPGRSRYINLIADNSRSN